MSFSPLGLNECLMQHHRPLKLERNTLYLYIFDKERALEAVNDDGLTSVGLPEVRWWKISVWSVNPCWVSFSPGLFRMKPVRRSLSPSEMRKEDEEA